jgi:hypothetical protein
VAARTGAACAAIAVSTEELRGDIHNMCLFLLAAPAALAPSAAVVHALVAPAVAAAAAAAVTQAVGMMAVRWARLHAHQHAPLHGSQLVQVWTTPQQPLLHPPQRPPTPPVALRRHTRGAVCAVARVAPAGTMAVAVPGVTPAAAAAAAAPVAALSLQMMALKRSAVAWETHHSHFLQDAIQCYHF